MLWIMFSLKSERLKWQAAEGFQIKANQSSQGQDSMLDSRKSRDGKRRNPVWGLGRALSYGAEMSPPGREPALRNH